MSNCSSASGGRVSLGVADMPWNHIARGRLAQAYPALRSLRDSSTIRASFCRPDRMSTNPEDGGLRNTLYKKETRSKRRMTPMRRFAWRIVSAIGVGLIRLFWKSCRVVRVVGDEHMASALAKTPSLIPVYWHQHQLFCGKYLLEQAPRGL